MVDSQPIFTIEQFVGDFLKERRLTDAEIDAVVKIARNDPSLRLVLWDARVADVPYKVLQDLKKVMSAKVIYWMDKYRPTHSARCLFTGES